MLRLTLELLPTGSEKDAKTLGSLIIANIGGTEEEGDYWVDLYEADCTNPQPPFRLDGWPRRRKAWDLVLGALRRAIGYRNPYNGFPRDEQLYIKHKGRYVPVAPFEGFPAKGIFLVYTDGEEYPPTVRRASFRWIGDVPESDALTYAAAHVHHDRACKKLADFKSREAADTFEMTRRLEGGEPLYRWTEPSIAGVVDCVLSAIAEGNEGAEGNEEAEGNEQAEGNEEARRNDPN